MKLFLVCLLAFVALSFAQENEVKFVIDPFTAQSDTIVILIPSGGISPTDPSGAIVDTRFVSSNTILGGERDLQLTVSSGDGNLILSTGVSGGQYTAATPNEARGNSLLQLDGPDASMNLNAAGLSGIAGSDFTGSNAFAIRVLIESDLPGSVVFRFFSPGGGQCVNTVQTPGDDTLNEYILPYSSFSQGCNFANIGAVEIFIVMDDNVDVLLQDFSTWGPVETCICNCPAFTCELFYDLDGGEFDYYWTSILNGGGGGVFNPTTDFSTVFVDPSATPSPRPPGVSASPSPSRMVTRSPVVDDDDDDTSFTYSLPDFSGESSSGASTISFVFAFVVVIAVSLI